MYDYVHLLKDILLSVFLHIIVTAHLNQLRFEEITHENAKKKKNDLSGSVAFSCLNNQCLDKLFLGTTTLRTFAWSGHFENFVN